ncbi:hypothetical protein BGW38_010008 [Lunasporangiospora selenospora]|uniref:Uncharacterized protein n=1 Tax=Lunasporangiospora selenospora TaxID=979761 RepID=A0A9P6FWM2_9FUNG|nr:hypothetical protein BGW38_010008 [Lunasporangiospora selenospora]
MNIFKKSNKNKTTSAAPTPAQTPRTSMDESRTQQRDTSKQFQKHERESEVLYSLISKSLAGGHSGPYIL